MAGDIVRPVADQGYPQRVLVIPITRGEFGEHQGDLVIPSTLVGGGLSVPAITLVPDNLIPPSPTDRLHRATEVCRNTKPIPGGSQIGGVLCDDLGLG
jgi:hypothetical protein